MRIFANRQNNTTNTQEANTRIETGWGVMQFGSAAANINEAVVFQTAFSSIPIVTISFGGDHGNTAVALGNGGNNIHMQAVAKAVFVTVSGFQAYVFHAAGANWSINDVVYYHWIAIGK